MLPQVLSRLRPPRKGIIRLGVKEQTVTKGGKTMELPKEVDYFVVPEPLATELEAAGGSRQPQMLLVMLPVDDPDQVFPASFSRYDGKLCTVQCNGTHYWKWPKDGARTEGACCRTPEGSIEWPDGPKSCGAEAIGRLSVIPVEGALGVYQIPIGGEQRIADLYGDLLTYSRLFGRLTGIVFELRRLPQEIQVATTDDKRLARTGWPVRLFCSITTRAALETSGHTILALPPTAELPQRAEGVVDVASPEPDEDDHAPWDISASIAAAVRLGLTTEEYAAYVHHKYKPHTVSDLTPHEEGEQETILREATNKPAYAKKFIAHVKKIAAGA